MVTVQPQSPAGPTPSPPQEGWHGDAPGPPAASGESPAAAGPGGEIAALDKQLAVVSGGEERKPDGGASAGAGGGGKLVAEAMRKYAAPRSSRFHGVTRCGLAILGNRELRALPVLVPLLVLWIDRLFAAALAAG